MTDDGPVTRGGYQLPPPHDDRRFVGPADDPERYELIGPGIHGGEGTTWQARYHGRLQRPLPLAVKQLRAPAGVQGPWPRDEDRRRWQDQAALLRHLQLEHVVRVYEIFLGPPPAHAVHLVMEWIDGPTLSDLCRDSPATADTLTARLGYVAQAAAALTELSSSTRATGNPSVHRDVKPGNCIINDDRGLVLIDISTLRLVDDGFDPVGLHTPEYTAPEVLAAPRLPRTPATDVYSLGALATYCLTGRDPTAGGGGDSVRLAAAVRDCGVADPDALAAHIMTTLDPDPQRRPTDLDGWARRLTSLGRRRRSRVLPAVVAVAAAVLLAGTLLSFGPLSVRGDGRPAQVSTPPRSPLPSGVAGQITTPLDGADVKQCSYFEGTATLPAGMTLILSMHNVDNGDPSEYAELIHDFQDPTKLPQWRGAQYFGQRDDTVGQTYRVRLVAVPAVAATAWNDDDGGDPGTALAAGGIVLDEVTLHRVKGQGPNGCEGN